MEDEINYVGVTRKIDSLGRLVIPKEIRTQFGWRDGEELTLMACVIDNEEVVIVRKTRPYCAICGSTKRLQRLSEYKSVCKPCLNKMAKKTPEIDE